MIKRKMNQNLYKGMTYTPKIIPIFEPSSWWGGGKWETGKKHNDEIGGAKYTGQEKREIIGYQLVMMGIVDGEEWGIIEKLPKFDADIHKDKESAISHFNYRFSHIKPSEVFSPFTKIYPSGVINEFKL